MQTTQKSHTTTVIQTLEVSLGEHSDHVYTVYRFVGNGTGPAVYIQSGIHGNEHPGILVAVKLIEIIKGILSTHPLKGSITIVPICNPIALSQTVQGEILGRFDIHTGKNFNRHFPDLANRVIDKCHSTCGEDIDINTVRAVLKDMLDEHTHDDPSEQMKANLFQLASQHDIVIDLHADNRSILHVYTPEHGADITRILTAELGCNLALTGTHDSNGGLDDALNYFWPAMQREFSLKTLPVAYTIELRGRYDISEELTTRDATALYHFLCRMNVIDAKVPAKKNTHEVFPVSGISLVKASKCGILKLHRTLGEHIVEGDLVAEIIELDEAAGDSTIELQSVTDGILFCHSFYGVVPQGQTVYKIAGAKQLHNEAGNALEK